ncbi:hypothetical protein IAT38_002705 [Cryptococcus sp. DSM 104549]
MPTTKTSPLEDGTLPIPNGDADGTLPFPAAPARRKLNDSEISHIDKLQNTIYATDDSQAFAWTGKLSVGCDQDEDEQRARLFFDHPTEGVRLFFEDSSGVARAVSLPLDEAAAKAVYDAGKVAENPNLEDDDDKRREQEGGRFLMPHKFALTSDLLPGSNVLAALNDRFTQPLRFKLAGLHAYTEGGCMGPYRNRAEEFSGKLGILILTLPSPFTGGDLQITKSNITVTHTLSTSSSTTSDDDAGITWTLFYTDSTYAFSPLSSGTRICLVYDIFMAMPPREGGGMGEPLLLEEMKADTVVRKGFRALVADEEFLPEGGTVVVGLLNSYADVDDDSDEEDEEAEPEEKTGLSPNELMEKLETRLKAADKAVLGAVEALGLEWKFMGVFNPWAVEDWEVETVPEGEDGENEEDEEEEEQSEDSDDDSDDSSIHFEDISHKTNMWTTPNFEAIHHVRPPTTKVKLTEFGCTKDESLVWITEPADYFMINQFEAENGDECMVTLGAAFFITIPPAGQRQKAFEVPEVDD